MDTDLALLNRYSQQRDAQAYAELVRRYAHLVYATSLRITRNGADAEDVTQECFLALARQSRQIRESVAGWLHTAARTRALDLIRGRQRRAEREAASAECGVRGEAGVWQQVEPEVDQAIGRLPEELRACVQLYYLAGRKQSEVAAELGIGQASVSRNLERGIELIRKYLADQGVALGAGAVALEPLLAEAAHEAPQTLCASLAKIGMAGVKPIGSGGMAVMKVAACVGLAMGLAAVPMAMQISSATGQTAGAGAPAPAVLGSVFRPVDGTWREEAGTWIGSGPATAHLVSADAFDSEALAVEFEAKLDRVEAGKLGTVLCSFSAYPTLEAARKAKETLCEFQLRGPRVGRLRYPWAAAYHGAAAAEWTRDMLVEVRGGDFVATPNQWYRLRAQRVGKTICLYVNGVPVSQISDERAAAKLYVWLGAMEAEARFRDIRVVKADAPADADRLFAPYQQQQTILARYPDEVKQEVSIVLGERNEEAGLTPVLHANRGMELAQDPQGEPCRSFLAGEDSRGPNFRIAPGTRWDPRNDAWVEVEYFDAVPGGIAVMAPAWWGFPSTEDVAFTNTGTWKTARFHLRDADLAALPGATFWVAALRSGTQELMLRRVKVQEVGKPAAAWEEVVAAYQQEIARRGEEWTVPFYMAETARILESRLGRTDEAKELIRQIEQRHGDSEALVWYRQWQAAVERGRK